MITKNKRSIARKAYLNSDYLNHKRQKFRQKKRKH